MYTLTNAKEMNLQHPATFDIPSPEEIDATKPGMHVKLIFHEHDVASERMWVRITKRSGDDFEGELDNDPFELSSIQCGDLVPFHSHHIVDIF